MKEISQSLSKAWDLFDNGRYREAEALYLACFAHIPPSDTGKFHAVLMGLLYTEAFLEKYDEARKYGNLLLKDAKDDDERHTAIHQLGMVERMAGNYKEAMALFSEEESIIHASFPEDHWRMSANFYEQGYVMLKMKQYAEAQEAMLMALDSAIQAKDEMCKGCAYRGMGEIMTAVGNSEKAMVFFEKAVVAFTNAGDWKAVEEIQANLALQ